MLFILDGFEQLRKVIQGRRVDILVSWLISGWWMEMYRTNGNLVDNEVLSDLVMRKISLLWIELGYKM